MNDLVGYLPKDLLNPKRNLFLEMLFGIQASRDVKLSNVARSLDEEIRLIKTENRLSRNAQKEDLTQAAE